MDLSSSETGKNVPEEKSESATATCPEPSSSSSSNPQNNEPPTTTSQNITPEKKTFECSSCGLNENYDYYGTRPPFCRSVIFEEKSYIMRDPFTSQTGNTMNFLLLGSHCGICNKIVCQDCSTYFTKRFCKACTLAHKHLFPEELRIKNKN